MRDMTSDHRPGRWLPILTAAAALLLAVAAAAADSTPLQLHADLPETLNAAQVERLGLFPDVPDLVAVSFARAAWGGVVARLAGSDVRLRYLTDQEWRDLRRRAAAVLAGDAAAAIPAPRAGRPQVAGDGDPAADLRAWPEVPLATTVKRTHRPRRSAALPPLRGHWQAVLEGGLRENITGFGDFFSPMGLLGVGFGYAFLERAVTMVNFTAGFGDMAGDFQDAFGDGRANSFTFSLAAVARQPVSRRVSVYGQVEGGYYIRSLLWGGLFVDPQTGYIREGLVYEQQDWGYGLRVGVLLQRRHPEKPRFLDIGIGLQTTPADRWEFSSDGRHFVGGDRDTWITLSLRFWDGI